MKKVNYIVVGQGLAGTVLAQTLLQYNKSVVVIDDHRLSKASRIAAGLYNPIVFKRLVKSWDIDVLLPFMENFYLEAEKALSENFYFKKKIVKLFTEDQERVLWIKKCKEAIGTYLDETIDDDFLKDIIYNLNGVAAVKHAGNLNTAVYLNAFRNLLNKSDALFEEAFDYKQLVISEATVVYKNITADKIIFCEGYKALENPYFNWLPFKLTKGEIITIHCPPLQQSERVINKGVFILPLGNDLYKVGATYEWDDLTEHPTEKGKLDLITKLEKVLRVPFVVASHEAGIRPTVKDRRPLIGVHPQHKSLAVFNGLGTKGVMLAPYFAKQLVDFLESNHPLNDEVNITRFV